MKYRKNTVQEFVTVGSKKNDLDREIHKLLPRQKGLEHFLSLECIDDIQKSRSERPLKYKGNEEVQHL